MKKWFWPITFVVLIWWLFFRKKHTMAPAIAGAQDPVTNLGSNLVSSLKAQDQVLKIVRNIPPPPVDTSDSLVDADAVTQNVVRPGEFIRAIRSNEEKILLKKDNPSKVQMNKAIPQQRDQMWWPKRMYIDAPEWLKNVTPCECGCGELIYRP